MRWAPDRDAVLDAGVAVVLTLLALLTLHDTVAGWGYLVVALLAALLGAAAGWLTTAARLPWLFVVPVLVVVYLLFGGALALRDSPVGGWLPGPATLGELTRLAVRGWAEVLTTLPPVDGTGPVLALVVLLALFGAGVGTSVATRTESAGAPLLPALVTLVVAILLGTADPGTLRPVGIASALLALAWAGVRSRRRQVATATGRVTRATTAGVILVAAAGIVALASPVLPGTGTNGREVLRAHVTPPLDLSQFPSPLAGFRQFRPSSEQFTSKTLFTVRGLPEGAQLRIATLDAYDGLVWGVRNDAAAPADGRALNTFQRIGARVDPGTSGRRVTLRVTVGAAYAGSANTSGWLPDTGALTAVTFAGRRAADHQDAVRYNLATGTAVVPDRLRTNDRYTVSAVIPAAPRELPATATPGGDAEVDPGDYAVVQPTLAKLTAKRAGTPWEQLRTVAQTLRTQGAYSDGAGGEAQFLPGHSTGRLKKFLDADQYVGNDEQYAAVYALMANALGFPARVVVGAVPTSDRVQGSDVHAWVEVRLAGRGWTTVATDVFTPPTSQKPRQQPVQQPDDSSAAVVPPPNAVRPPSSLDQLARNADSSSRRSQRGDGGDGWQLPGFVVAALKWGGPPVLLIVLVVGGIVGAKALRRRRRRTTGPPDVRLAAGWRELLDQARDLGVPLTADMTRREQARAMADYDLGPLAARADGALFGERGADDAETLDYWTDVSRTRREMLLGRDRVARWKARLSLRSLRAMPLQHRA